MYLGTYLSNMNNIDSQELWAMYSDKYCTSAVINVESVLENCGLIFLPKRVSPLRCGHCTDMGMTGYLKEGGVQWYQNIIGTMRWAVETGRIDILLEV